MTAKLATGFGAGAGIVRVNVPVADAMTASVIVNTMSPGAAPGVTVTESDNPSADGEALTLVGSETDHVGTSPEGNVVAAPAASSGAAVSTVLCPGLISTGPPKITNEATGFNVALSMRKIRRSSLRRTALLKPLLRQNHIYFVAGGIGTPFVAGAGATGLTACAFATARGTSSFE